MSNPIFIAIVKACPMKMIVVRQSIPSQVDVLLGEVAPPVSFLVQSEASSKMNALHTLLKVPCDV